MVPFLLPPRTYVLLVTVTCLSFVGCGTDGSSEEGVDRRAFRTAYDEIRAGPPMTDAQFAEIVTLAQETCDDNPDVFALTHAMLRDSGAQEGFELSVEYFCPDRLDELPEGSG